MDAAPKSAVPKTGAGHGAEAGDAATESQSPLLLRGRNSTSSVASRAPATMKRNKVPASAVGHLLFKELDAEKRDKFLKGLIDIEGLRSFSGDASERLAALEKVINDEVLSRGAVSLEELFVGRADYDAKEANHWQEHQGHARRLQDLESAVECPDVWRTQVTESVSRLDAMRCRMDSQEQSVAKAFEAVERAKQSAQKGFDTAMAAIADITGLEKAVDQNLRKELQSLSDRLDSSNEGIKTLSDEVHMTSDFLRGPPLRSAIVKVVNEVAGHYMTRENLQKETQDIFKAMIGPVMKEIHHLAREVDIKVTALHHADTKVEKHVQEVSQRVRNEANKVHLMEKDIHHRIDQCALITSLEQERDNLLVRIKSFERQFLDLRDNTSMKLQEMVDRLQTLCSVMTDHEHALQHHAEELLNRSTKYDLVLCNHRIDACSVKDKVDAEIIELQNKMSWQNGKLELLFNTAGWGVQGNAIQAGKTNFTRVDTINLRLDTQEPDDGDGSADRAKGENSSKQEAVKDRGAADHSSADKVPAQASATEECSLLRQQLESLTQGVVTLGRLAIVHGPSSFSSLKREVRMERGAECLHHLVNVLDWISHRRAPAAWDPGMLATLALQAVSCCPDSPRGPIDEDTMDKVTAAARALHAPKTPDSGGRLSARPIHKGSVLSRLSGVSAGASTEVGTSASGGLSELSSPMPSLGLSTAACRMSMPVATAPRYRIPPTAMAGGAQRNASVLSVASSPTPRASTQGGVRGSKPLKNLQRLHAAGPGHEKSSEQQAPINANRSPRPSSSRAAAPQEPLSSPTSELSKATGGRKGAQTWVAAKEQRPSEVPTAQETVRELIPQDSATVASDGTPDDLAELLHDALPPASYSNEVDEHDGFTDPTGVALPALVPGTAAATVA